MEKNAQDFFLSWIQATVHAHCSPLALILKHYVGEGGTLYWGTLQSDEVKY